MANIHVSFSEMEGAAAQLSSGREEITSRLLSLESQIQNLVTSGFVTDRASGRFAQVFAEYSAGAKSVITHLNEIEQFLRMAALTMRDLDEQMASKIF